jgi:hypothetical protein
VLRRRGRGLTNSPPCLRRLGSIDQSRPPPKPGCTTVAPQVLSDFSRSCTVHRPSTRLTAIGVLPSHLILYSYSKYRNRIQYFFVTCAIWDPYVAPLDRVSTRHTLLEQIADVFAPLL